LRAKQRCSIKVRERVKGGNTRFKPAHPLRYRLRDPTEPHKTDSFSIEFLSRKWRVVPGLNGDTTFPQTLTDG
jgi:hypothetical protein